MVFKEFNLDANVKESIDYYSPWSCLWMALYFYISLIGLKVLKSVFLIIFINPEISFMNFCVGLGAGSILIICSIILGVFFVKYIIGLISLYINNNKLPVLTVNYRQAKTFLNSFPSDFRLGKIDIENNRYYNNTGYNDVTEYYGFTLFSPVKVKGKYYKNIELIKGTFLNSFIIYNSYYVNNFLNYVNDIAQQLGVTWLQKKESKKIHKEVIVKNTQSTIDILNQKIEKIKKESQSNLAQANDMLNSIEEGEWF